MKFLALASLLFSTQVFASSINFECSMPQALEANRAAFNGSIYFSEQAVELSLSNVEIIKKGTETSSEIIDGVSGEVSVKIYPESTFGSVVTSVTLENKQSAEITKMKINLGLDTPLNSYVITSDGYKYRAHCLIK
ncbi:hypothetical protein M899_2630 [Bacteriovorax sp. BSW11_IV]|uniref:hypothetical protein n=1 Tax=Bacteriovorax sp. BSW11_IV TaxID=1353529 RepID=UPI00038A2B79|nr:hypothetical protein [Bacteriovorax sp. BSW11_IV]EQC49882.1 hypothetical protein M899_2630 [Bacteriovorax sp. BSW11_IV]